MHFCFHSGLPNRRIAATTITRLGIKLKEKETRNATTFDLDKRFAAEDSRNMILTLFYAGATLVQSWRLRSITTGISSRIRDHCSVSFYRTCTEGDDGKCYRVIFGDCLLEKNQSSQITMTHFIVSCEFE